jgi:16S rRNA C967 or C1407 C5-methylase (RsmB/RsmF family)
MLHRQEAVSLLPVLFLDVKCDQRILDMCAAPGTKSSFALDLMALDAAARCQ